MYNGKRWWNNPSIQLKYKFFKQSFELLYHENCIVFCIVLRENKNMMNIIDVLYFDKKDNLRAKMESVSILGADGDDTRFIVYASFFFKVEWNKCYGKFL